MLEPQGAPPQIYHGDFDVEMYFLQWSEELQKAGGLTDFGVNYDACDGEFMFAMKLRGVHGYTTLKWMKVCARIERQIYTY